MELGTNNAGSNNTNVLLFKDIKFWHMKRSRASAKMNAFATIVNFRL